MSKTLSFFLSHLRFEKILKMHPHLYLKTNSLFLDIQNPNTKPIRRRVLGVSPVTWGYCFWDGKFNFHSFHMNINAQCCKCCKLNFFKCTWTPLILTLFVILINTLHILFYYLNNFKNNTIKGFLYCLYGLYLCATEFLLACVCVFYAADLFLLRAIRNI